MFFLPQHDVSATDRRPPHIQALQGKASPQIQLLHGMHQYRMGIFGPSFEAYRRIEDRFQTRRLLHAFGVWLRACQMAQLKLHLMCKPKMLARTVLYATRTHTKILNSLIGRPSCELSWTADVSVREM